jgi:hypothetical protein
MAALSERNEFSRRRKEESDLSKQVLYGAMFWVFLAKQK